MFNFNYENCYKKYIKKSHLYIFYPINENYKIEIINTHKLKISFIIKSKNNILVNKKNITLDEKLSLNKNAIITYKENNIEFQFHHKIIISDLKYKNNLITDKIISALNILDFTDYKLLNKELFNSNNCDVVKHFIKFGYTSNMYNYMNMSYIFSHNLFIRKTKIIIGSESTLNLNKIIKHHTYNIFVINNIKSGGANKYLYDLMSFFSIYNINFIFITNTNDLNIYIDIIKNNDILIINSILNTNLTFDIILNLINNKNLKLILSIHDNYYLNNSYLNDHEYNMNVHKLHDVIPEYKKKLFYHAYKIIFPTKYIYDTYCNLINNDDIKSKMHIITHPDYIYYSDKHFIPVINNKIINIGIITEINECKGEYLFNKIFKYHSTNNFTINYYIFSKYYGMILTKFCNVIFIDGYNEHEIYELLINHNIHGLLYFNKYPETYCYALSKGINSKLPILYTDLGAISERLNLLNSYYYFKLNPDTIKINYKSFINFIIQNQNSGIQFNSNRNFKLNINEFYYDLFNTNHFYKNIFNTIHSKIKPFAIYFPQFHEIEENNINYYKGFTDMINLKKSIIENKHNSINPLNNVLGMYNLETDDIIDTQITMAKNYGFYGFGIYYYWFSNNTITNKHKIFEKVINKFFQKEYTDFKVFFIYCNENWTNNVAFNTSINKNKHKIINFYIKKNIEKNLNDLLEYFRHPNYYKIDNKPVFFIHHPNKMTDIEIDLFYSIANEILIKNNFNGIYLSINCISKEYSNYYNYYHHFDYMQKHFLSNFTNNYINIDYEKYVNNFLQENNNIDNSNKINSVFTNFDNSIRHFCNYNSNKSTSKTINNTLELFGKFLDIQFTKYSDKKEEINKIFLVNAWNEWGEQMVMEPSNQNAYMYLKLFYYKLVEHFVNKL